MSVSISFGKNARGCITPRQTSILLERLDCLLKVVGIEGEFLVTARHKSPGSSSRKEESLEKGLCLGVMNEDKGLVIFTLQTNGNDSCFLYDIKMPEGVNVRDFFPKFKDAVDGKIVAQSVVKTPVTGSYTPKLSFGTQGCAPVVSAGLVLQPPAEIRAPDLEKSASQSLSASSEAGQDEQKSSSKKVKVDQATVELMTYYLNEKAAKTGSLTKEEVYSVVGKLVGSTNNYQIGQIVRLLKSSGCLSSEDGKTFSLSKTELTLASPGDAQAVTEPVVDPDYIAKANNFAGELDEMEMIRAWQICFDIREGMGRREVLLKEKEETIAKRIQQISALQAEIQNLEEQKLPILSEIKLDQAILAHSKVKGLLAIYSDRERR